MTGPGEPDVALVRALLAEQHPDLAGLEVSLLGTGWDNAVFRVGPELTVRLPRRPEGVPLIANEQRWLPGLAPELPLPVPAPVRTGRPGCGYPWPWSVCPWLPGHPASTHPPADHAATAHALGAFLMALHRPAPAEAPPNPYRGVPLAARATRFHDALADLAGRPERLSPTRRAWAVARWDALAGAPPWPHAPAWLHGDLHPHNLLVHGGRLSAVVDFGDLTAGDPATDLAVAWMLLAPEGRRILRDATGHDDATWTRAEAWAVALAVAYLDGSPDGSPMLAVADRTLAELGAPDR
ncbi:MAG: aminoglycoside phosphotransferase family protein [Actinobacteria bacterium]|nr:aminoglycoside phosphotransferase family protein [Actinomycetota bacterium]